MKRQNKRIGALLIVTLFISAFTQLYGQRDQQMERFKDEKIKFFNEKLELSAEEGELFWPLYQNLNNRRMKINEDERNLLTYYSSNSQFLSDEETDETIENFISLQKKRVDLDLKYHKKFVEIIGKKKTMLMYSLEREFRLYILRKFSGSYGGEGKPGGQGRFRGTGGR